MKMLNIIDRLEAHIATAKQYKDAMNDAAAAGDDEALADAGSRLSATLCLLATQAITIGALPIADTDDRTDLYSMILTDAEEFREILIGHEGGHHVAH